jgi:hypothetical protein
MLTTLSLLSDRFYPNVLQWLTYPRRSQIGSYLRTSPVNFAKIVKIEQHPNEKRHSLVWHEIFRDYKWLDRMADSGYNPILV